MRIVALDPSLTATGVADSRAPEGPYVLAPPRALRGMERIHWYRQQIQGIVAGADLVVIEGYAFGAKGRAVYNIAELGGVLRYLIWCMNVPVVEINPSTLKVIATGKGNSPKEGMLQAAWQRLGYERHENNEADALWLLQAALVHYALPGAIELPKMHLRGFEKIKWPAQDELERSAA